MAYYLPQANKSKNVSYEQVWLYMYMPRELIVINFFFTSAPKMYGLNKALNVTSIWKASRIQINKRLKTYFVGESIQRLKRASLQIQN